MGKRMSNEEQIEYWNGEAGERWAEDDHIMEQLLRPVTEDLLAHIQTDNCKSALDIGCGGGSQSLLLAQQLGADARVLGLDISAPMLEVARGKLKDEDTGRALVEFRQGDAAVEPFEEGAFDLLFSRFGVMFFDDPAAAFANISRALCPGAQLGFCCWRPLKDNDWTWIPLQAALAHVPPPEPPEPGAPGPFALADPARVESILAASGFGNIELKQHPITLRFGHYPTLGENLREMARIGPISRLLAEQDGDTIERVFSAMEEALGPYFKDGALQLPGSVWFVTATAHTA
jgi:SAM-dependent methyltransferase